MEKKKIEIEKGTSIEIYDNREKCKIINGDVVDIIKEELGYSFILNNGYEIFIQTE